MKNIFFTAATFVLLTTFSTSISAQFRNSPANQDAKVRSILKNVMSNFQESTAISFDAAIVNRDPKKEEISRQKAKVLLSGSKYRITIDDMVVCCDDKAMYSIDNAAKEITINPISDSETDIFNPAKLLKNYDKNFRSKLIRDERAQYVVDLNPRTKQNYHKIRLLINKSSYQITKVEVYNYNASRNECTISQYTKTSANDADFTYDASKYKGYEVIDMR